MLSKNNLKYLQTKLEPRKQRFTIKKFNVGVASVLIGTTFALFAGQQQVSADETTTTQVAAPSSTTPDSIATNSTPQNTTPTTQDTPQLTYENGEVSQVPEVNDTNAKGAGTLSDDGLTLTTQAGQKLTLSSNTLGGKSDNADSTGKGISLTYSGTGKTGDKVTIIIPKGTPYKITGFPTDPNNKHKVSNVDSADGKYSIQTATYITDDSDSYSATEYFKPISERTVSDVTKLATDVGKTEKFIQFYFNDVYQGSLKINQLMKPEMKPVLTRLVPGDEKNDVKVKVGSKLLYALNVNEDPNYVANQNTTVPQIIKNVNYGTTITIPVPEGFKLNQEDTKAYNAQYKGAYDKQNNFTVTQQNPGDDIIITVPKDNGAATYGSNPYIIAGAYTQDVAQETKVSAQNPITIVQRINDHGDTIQGTTASFSNILVPEDAVLAPAGDVTVVADGYLGYSSRNDNKMPFNIGKTESDHGVIGYYGFKTTLNTPVNNATITLTFTGVKNDKGKDYDTGKAYTKVDQIKVPAVSDTLPNLSGYTYQVTYTDGTTGNGSIEAGGTVTAETGKYIHSIEFTPSEISLSYTNNYNLLNDSQPAIGEVASKNMFVAYGTFVYTDDTGENQTTTSQISVTIPNLNGSNNQVITSSVIEQQMISKAGLKLNVNSQGLLNTDKSIPSENKNNLYVVLSKDDSQYVAKEYEPIFYYVLPQGSYYAGVNEEAMPGYEADDTRPKITTTMVDGQQVVKIDYTNTGYVFNNSQRAQAWIYAKTYPDAPNYTQVTGSIYINPGKMVNDDGSSSDHLVKLANRTLTTTPFIPDDNNIYKIQDFTWEYEASGGKSVQTLATGNTAGEDSVVSAHSDTKGSTDMTYYFSTMNYVSPQQAAADIKDTYIILNLPQESDTSFQFTLKNPKTLGVQDPVQYIGSDDTLEFIYKYSEDIQPLDKWKEITGIPDGLVDSYVTADQVKDWSKIKSVMVSIPLIQKNIPVGRFKILGQDLTLAQDAGKTGIIEGEGFAAGFQPFTPGTPATITVTGQATIHARYHYIDANGKNQYLELPDKTYVENKDTVREADFLKVNQDKIPAGYELVGTTGNPTWTNGEKTWQADGTNDTAAFGQVAKYYMDGDTVTFELQHKIKEVTVTDNIKPNTPIAENPSVNYPTGVDVDNLQKQPTFTVNVTVDGNRDDTLSKVQTSTFTRSAFVDEVTGQLVDTPEHPGGYSAWGPANATWNQVELPVKQGYFRTMSLPDDVTKVSPTIILAKNFDKITANHPDTTVNVAYTKLGHIQPVDENGNPLSNTLTGYATPQYKNDANDPEKAILPALPQINGYTAYLNDQPVSATNAYSLPQDLSQNLNVTYKKDDQHLKIQVLDVNDNVNGEGEPIALTQDILTTINATADMIGKSGDAVDKNELQANLTKIKGYFEDQGYKFYAQSPIIDTFDFDTKQDQSVTLKLIHDTEAQAQPKAITRTVNYLDESGKPIQPAQTDTKTLVRYQVKDKVNGKILGYTQDPTQKNSQGLIATPFSEANANDAYVSQVFAGVTTPDLKGKGYEFVEIQHDGHQVNEILGETVNGNSTDMTYDVIYTPHIITVTKDTNVQPGQPIGDTGYVYPQTSHFNANKLQGVATREINFSYEDNTQAEPTITQVINFERQGTLNLVTGDFTPDTTWSIKDATQDNTVISTKNFAEVSIPTIPGYTPKINGQVSNTVAASNPTQPQAKEVVNVVYVANPQVINYTVIDDTANETVVNEEKLLDGVTNQEITSENQTSYEDVLDNLAKKGYKVISNDDLPGKFGSTNPTLKIHVVHDTEVSKQTKDIKRTINFKDTAGKTIQPAQTDTKTLVRYQVKDKVNGKILGYTQDPNQKDNNGVIEAPFNEANANDAYVSQVFDAQITPDLKSKGYDLDRIEHDGTTVDEIPETTVNGNSTDLTYDIIYTPHIIIVNKDTNVQGGQPIGDTGYIYPENHQFDASQLQGIAKRVINFKFENQTLASPTVQQVITFERQGALNLVTGKFIPDSNWTVSNATQDDVEISTKDFAEVSAPEIPGYTPSQATVAKEILTQPQADSVVNITYTANPQRAKIQFIDDTTQKDLVTISENGTSEGIIATTNTTAKLAEYLAAGYEVVSDNFTDSPKTYDRDDNQDQQYAVHLKHKTVTVNPGDNKKTSDKLPDNSRMNYPDAATEDNLHAQSIRTINFESTDNKLTIQPVIQTINYRRTATIDEVTGDVTYANWDAEGQNQWSSYQVPVKEGYFANVSAVNQVDNVEANQNEVVTVTYKPLGNVIAVNEQGQRLNVESVQYQNDTNDATQVLATFAPVIPGYTVKPSAQIKIDKTNKAAVTPADLAQDTNVIYSANPQVIKYTVIDDTSKQPYIVDAKLLDGVTDQAITQENQASYQAILDGLADKGYKVISNPSLPSKFGSSTQTLEIHVVHDTELIPELKTVTRTIEFIDKQSQQPISNVQPVEQTVKLKRYQVKDKVTNELLGYASKDNVVDDNGVKTFTQSIADGNEAYVIDGTPTEFARVPVLDLTESGYEAGMDTNNQVLTAIPMQEVDATTADETIKIYYNQHVIPVDYDTPKTGNVGSTNYVYPTNSNFDAAKLTKTTSRTINYVYGKDTVKPGSTGDAAVKQTIEYRQTARLNLVTGEFTPNDDWKAYKSLTNNIEEADATKFAAVDSPKHDGYTPDQLTVGATNQANDITVIYTANPAKAIVSFNDVTDDNQKVTDTLLTGITDGKLDHHKVDDQLKELEKQGYKLVQGGNHFDKNATAQTFDTQADQDTISQQYGIDLKHVISDVITHTTIPAAGTKIDGTDVTYPEIDKLSMTVTRTIYYVYNEGKKAFDDVVQSITYTRTARVDAVKAYKNQLDAVTYTAWVPENEDSFSALDEKHITGYTADKQVDAAKVLFVDETPQNAEVTVTYSPDYQVAQFKFIDIDDNNAEIMNQLIEGQTAEPIKFDTTKVIDALKKKGYVLVDDEYQTAKKVFDNTDNSNQTDAKPQIFKISMKHKIIEVENTGKTFTDKLPDNLDMNYPSGVSKDDLNKTVTRVIRVNDGAKTIVANQPVTFTRTAFVDEVTGQIKELLDWQNQAGTNWPEYTVEPKLGYTPKAIDEKGNLIPIVNGKIAAKDVDANTSSENIEIFYVPQKQELTFAVIDNQNPENPMSLLEVDYLDLQGLSDEKIDSANVQAKIDELKQALSKKGYVFEKQDEIPVAFDNDSMQAQTIKLYFKHLQVVIDDVPNQEQNIPTTDLKYPTVDALNKTVSRNISSKFTNKEGKPFKTITQTIELRRQANIDVVTQEVTYTDWQPAQGNGMFNSYVVPTISGYTPSVAEITEERALENGQPRDDERIVVSYRPNKREIKINYIDAITKQKLADSKVFGQTDETVAINYENPLSGKYVLDDTDLVKQITIRGDKDPIITVPLSHKEQTKTIVVPITRVITVIKPDGTKENISQSVSVEKTIVTDLVTNKVIKNTSSSAVLPNYVVPTILGYTPNMNAVDQLMVQSESTVKPVEISYTANPQKTDIVFVDDDNNETVIHQSDLVGKTNQQVALAIVNPDASKYEVVKTYPTTYTFKADNNEPVIIHLKHKTQEDKEFKTVARKIILQIPGKADEVKIDQVKLSRSIVKDIVTGEVKPKSDWTSSQFTGFDAPEIKGMTPNIQRVAAQTITDMSADSEVRIVYTPINVAINYRVIDAKTHQVIKPTQKLGESSLNQVVPEILVAKYQHVLDQLRNAGYVIASYDSLPEVIEDGVNTLNISVSKPEPIEVIPTNPTTSNTGGTEAKEPDANVKPGPNNVEANANVKPGPNKVEANANVKPEPNKVEADANVKPEPNKVEPDTNVKPGPNKVEADSNVNTQPNKVEPGKPTNVVPNNLVTTNTFDTEVKVPDSIVESNPNKVESVKPVITVDPVTQNTGDTEIKVLDTFAETSSKEETKPEISFQKIHAIHEQNRMLPQTGDDSSAVVSEIMGIFAICLGLTLGINLESKRKKK